MRLISAFNTLNRVHTTINTRPKHVNAAADARASCPEENMPEPRIAVVGAGAVGGERDVQRGRRSGIDFTNGSVVLKGLEAGVSAPTHAAVTELVRRIERGELKPDPKNI